MYPPLTCGSLLDGAHPTVGNQKDLVLLKRDGQNVIFKSFEDGETIPTHHHDGGNVLVAVLSRQSLITQEESHVDVQASDYVIFPAGAPRPLACRQAARILIYH